MTTFTVTTANDVVNAGDGKLSLREAVTQANATAAADTIVFAKALEGRALTLSGGELVFRRDVTIDGDLNNDGVEVGLSGGDTQRILRTSGSGMDLTLNDLTLAHGFVHGYGDGGAVFIGGGRAALNECTLRDNNTISFDPIEGGSGGALYAESGSRVSINKSIFYGNTSFGDGGAIGTAANVTLTIRNSELSSNHASYYGGGGAISSSAGGSLLVEGCNIHDNRGYDGGAILLQTDTNGMISHSTINDNAGFGGGIASRALQLTIEDSTIAGNWSNSDLFGEGGGVRQHGGSLNIRNSTVTDNVAESPSDTTAQGGGIWATGVLEISNSIVSGNVVWPLHNPPTPDLTPDIFGTITISNGHNIFGSDVLGNVPGDRENVAAGALFANIDPRTGGGLHGANGEVALLNSAINPALSGGDVLAAPPTDQSGSARPLPAGGLPDIGASELSQNLFSTAPSAGNDVLTGTAAANTIAGLARNDLISGLAGDDTLNGNDGSDLIDGGGGRDVINAGDGSDLVIGGSGNDQIDGGTGNDLASFAGSTAVVVDLSLTVDKAIRGSETDTLTGIEGAIGSGAADSFKGDALANFFQGGLGKDIFTGGGERDLYDFNSVTESGVGSTKRDVITDFAHLTDKLDLAGIDADTTTAGNQAFHWVGTAKLTGSPGEVGWFTDDGDTFIRASNDTDASAELQIQLNGMKTLTEVDFYL